MTVDLAQFHAAFFEESRETLDGMEAALLGLDVGAPSAEAINTIFRAAHSIKGGSGMFNFTAVTSFTHSLETLLDAVRSGQKQLSAATIDMLLKSVDVLREMLGSLQAGTALNEQRAADVQFDIEMEIANGSAPAPTAAAPARAAAEAVPPPAALATPAALSSVTASSAAAAPSTAAPTEPPHAPSPPHHVEAAPAPARPSAAARSAAPSPDAGSIRVSIDKLNELMNTVGELVIVQSMLSEQGTTIEGSQAQSMRANLAVLERNMRSLQECVMRVRMLPINTVFSRFPRMVRDLAQRLNKQIELKIVGEQTELDKTVLEKIGDPLTHLVRNCVDHGIEPASQRVAKGKPAQGTVRMEALHRGGNVVVEVSDDGAGLNKDRILAKAQGRGLVPMDAQLTEEEIHELIFAPGLSTQEQATDLSGRGVGMDVVRRNIQELGGTVKIGSTFGQGSKFTITLPLTLAIMDGQSVCVGRETYILPLVSMVQSMQLRPGEVKSLAAQMEVFEFRGEYVPIVRLYERFAVEPRSNELCRGIIVIVEGDGRRIGLFVDELLGQQQVVIKSLRDNYRDVHGISGATILGNGAVALILDVPGLVRGIATPRAA